MHDSSTSGRVWHFPGIFEKVNVLALWKEIILINNWRGIYLFRVQTKKFYPVLLRSFFSFGLFFCHSVLFVRLSIRPVCLFVSVCIVFFLSLLILTFSLCFSLNPYIPISLFPTFSLLFPPRHPTLSPLPPSLSLLIILLHFPVSISLFPHTIISR